MSRSPSRSSGVGLTKQAASGTFASLRQQNLDLVAGDRRADYIPTFTKYASNPIMTLASLTTLTSMQWPCLVRVDTLIGSPTYGEKYRIYYSTDHEGSTAGVGLLTATSPTGPWADRGLVYRDTNSGNQTETPTVLWNPDESLFFMYYHQVGATSSVAGEATLLATSPDGITWTRVGIVLDMITSTDTGNFPPPGLGYFRPFRIGKRWYGHSLLSGGNFPRFALWMSKDGRTWQLDPRPLGYGAEVAPAGTAINWNAGNVINWRGRLWWVGLTGNFTSGGAARQTTYGIAPISSDLRNLLSAPIPLFAALQGWETSPADNRSGGSCLVDTDGKLYLAYSGSATGFGVAVGV